VGAGDGPLALARDIEKLASRYASLKGNLRIDASLAVVTTDKCRKFHADFKPLRLVCTYAGPGTEWVANEAVQRAALINEIEDLDAANRAIVPDAQAIRRASAGHVVLLKGELYPGNAGNGAVHRSPPIAEAGERRLVLTLDASAAP